MEPSDDASAGQTTPSPTWLTLLVETAAAAAAYAVLRGLWSPTACVKPQSGVMRCDTWADADFLLGFLVTPALALGVWTTFAARRRLGRSNRRMITAWSAAQLVILASMHLPPIQSETCQFTDEIRHLDIRAKAEAYQRAHPGCRWV